MPPRPRKVLRLTRLSQLPLMLKRKPPSGSRSLPPVNIGHGGLSIVVRQERLEGVEVVGVDVVNPGREQLLPHGLALRRLFRRLPKSHPLAVGVGRLHYAPELPALLWRHRTVSSPGE